MKRTIFVFTFLGEFGFELLNWQGVIRKFSRTLDPSDVIVCGSRANLYPIYEMADLYIDISEVPLFKHSRACCYSATVGAGAPGRWVNRAFDAALRASLRSFLRERIKALRPEWTRSDRGPAFVFSSRKTELRGSAFGCDPDRLEEEGDVCERLNVGANSYEKVRPDLRVRAKVEQGVGFDLSEPYILIQTRARRVGPQSAVVPKDHLIGALAESMKVVLLSFETGRTFDSFSRFDPPLGCIHYVGRSFSEQACLIEFARRCVFFTEGQFGSHIYVPPFMGKDVVAIGPQSVYELGFTPIDFWNRHVFRFGGQIVAKMSEDVFASRQSVRELADEILCREILCR